ncbi:MAG: hypothetical protein JNK21_05825 [Rhodospirillaceae bacterium]|nr:hypothetical protein [Rhodospirillaceae bacterium]
MIAALKRPPFIGAFAFALVFIFTALGHTIMVEIMNIFQGQQFTAAFVQGLLGLVMVAIGVRYNHNENLATWLGFFGGAWLWAGWVEFSYVYYSRHIGIEPLDLGGGHKQLPEYMLLPSGIGLLASTLVFFYFNRETRCNAFRWMHKHLHTPVGKPTLNYQRNISTIVAMEKFYITWFFYVLLLVLYDRRILGATHPAMYVVFFMFIVWSIYLLNRLRKFTRLPSAFRYGIATALVAWNTVEILARWRFMTEVWIEPRKYALHMTIIIAAFITSAVIFALYPSVDAPDKDDKAGPNPQPAE